MERTTETSSSPARTSKPGEQIEAGVPRGSRARVVVSPWRISTRPASVRASLSASRTAGRDTPRTSAEAPLARKRVAGRHLAAEHLGDDLFEDVLGYRVDG